uniref:Uncharacterized protein n=1 Tax=Ciona intestinalis TaxID=7719 RepID=H2XM95_CIOIN
SKKIDGGRCKSTAHIDCKVIEKKDKKWLPLAVVAVVSNLTWRNCDVT